MSTGIDTKGNAGEVEKHEVKNEKHYLNSDLLADQDLLAAAYEGENREHAMGAWEAVKLHPMACFWAFIFCFTIVRTLHYSLRQVFQMESLRLLRTHS
jgi:SP family general alpha glucoside:H+ symporter-like MFS transporter